MIIDLDHIILEKIKYYIFKKIFLTEKQL